MILYNKSPVIFTKNDVKIIENKKSYNGFFSIIRCSFCHRLFNGKMSNIIYREIFERGESVAVLPYDPFLDKVVLIEQIRIAAYNNNITPWLLELIAGMTKKNENVEKVARREAIEEANLKIKRTKYILNYLSSPGGTSERLSIFIGEVDSNVAKGTYGLNKENENILVHVVSRQQAYLWVENGIINNSASIIALQWLELNNKKLKKEWLK